MLSMLQQMLLEDKDPIVRASVVRSLALLVTLMDDPDKYFQVMYTTKLLTVYQAYRR